MVGRLPHSVFTQSTLLCLRVAGRSQNKRTDFYKQNCTLFCLKVKVPQPGVQFKILPLQPLGAAITGRQKAFTMYEFI